MKLFIKIILILIVFLKTGNLLSENNIFNVNNIEIIRENNKSITQLADKAIEKGFDQLIFKILLKEDVKKVSNLSFSNIKDLVQYYNISDNKDKESDKINFSVTFDKDKIHDLFYKKNISYSDINDNDFYILPILLKGNEIFIFSNNFFYENWNESTTNDELIEFILPLENIEIIQKINQSRDNLLNLNINSLFEEYPKKNIALIFIDSSKLIEDKIYLKTKIEGKILSKRLVFRNNNIQQDKRNETMIYEIKEDLTNLVKSQNLIDIRIPSFLNVNMNLDKKNNLVLLNKKIKNIDLIENIFIQELNKDYVKFKNQIFRKIRKN